MSVGKVQAGKPIQLKAKDWNVLADKANALPSIGSGEKYDNSNHLKIYNPYEDIIPKGQIVYVNEVITDGTFVEPVWEIHVPEYDREDPDWEWYRYHACVAVRDIYPKTIGFGVAGGVAKLKIASYTDSSMGHNIKNQTFYYRGVRNYVSNNYKRFHFGNIFARYPTQVSGRPFYWESSIYLNEHNRGILVFIDNRVIEPRPYFGTIVGVIGEGIYSVELDASKWGGYGDDLLGSGIDVGHQTYGEPVVVSTHLYGDDLLVGSAVIVWSSLIDSIYSTDIEDIEEEEDDE